MDPRAQRLWENLRKVIVGKDAFLERVLTCFFADGHLLVEDVPGVGKTMVARALARSLETRFRRIQFTPDLLPSDVTGVSVFHPSRQRFEFHQGPVFTHVLLADELNRASPRTQSSLLECMEERQVTVDGTSYPLEKVFFVIATQNPIELDGTYPLPEAQLDRFLMRLEVGYPEAEEEMRILSGQIHEHPIESLQPVLDTESVLEMRQRVREVHVSAEMQRYIVSLTQATREHPSVRLGVSPRGGLALMRASQSRAFLAGEDAVTPDAVKSVAPAVLSHRMILDPHREHTGLTAADLVERILEEVAVPTAPHVQSTAEDAS